MHEVGWTVWKATIREQFQKNNDLLSNLGYYEWA